MNRRSFLASVPLASLASAFGAGKAAKGGEYIVYVGTNTHSKSKGIYVSRFDPATGRLIVVEFKSELRDLGGLQRQLERYARSCLEAARARDWRPKAPPSYATSIT